MAKRILSWFNPPPFDAPIRYPRQIPKAVVPSFIGEAGQVLNLLMHEGAGNVVKDYSGFNRHGRIYDAVWVDGKWGWCLSFNGTSAYVALPSPILSPPWTILAWIKHPATTVIREIYSEGNSTTNTPIKHFHITSGGYLYYYERADDGSANASIQASYIANDVWHLVGAVNDEANVYLYVDGVLRATGAYTARPVTVDMANIGRLGRMTPGYYFNGLIALPTIYGVAKDAGFIRKVFESQRVLFGV